MLCGECDLDCETNLKLNFFLSTPCWELLDEEKIGGETMVSLFKFLGSMVL